jgi:hypothetical protein
MTAPIDFVARRQAAIKAERELYAEWLAENERDDKIAQAHFEYEARLEREQTQREKYERAMAEKREP